MEDNGQERYDKFDALIARHSILIESLCIRHAAGDENRCTELRQDCLISLWHYLPKLREGCSPFHETAWVVWHCRSVFSHLRYRRRTHLFLPLDENMADTVAAPNDSRQRETIDKLATLLTPHERHAFLLMAEGYSAEDMAKELGIKHRSAVTLRHRIIEKLKKLV